MFFAYSYNLDIPLVFSIIKCESGFNPNSIGYNKDSKDYGIMQINSQHLQTAKAMGYDVKNNSLHNILFGLYLISQNGTADYQASKKCWQKELAILNSSVDTS